jgi:hypothetical protein
MYCGETYAICFTSMAYQWYISKECQVQYTHMQWKNIGRVTVRILWKTENSSPYSWILFVKNLSFCYPRRKKFEVSLWEQRILSKLHTFTKLFLKGIISYPHTMYLVNHWFFNETAAWDTSLSLMSSLRKSQRFNGMMPLFLFIFSHFFNIHTFIQSHSYNTFICRHSQRSLSICTAGLSSTLGSAPHGSFSHWAYKRWGDGERH